MNYSKALNELCHWNAGFLDLIGVEWLYLANKNFQAIGFPKLGTEPAPGATEPLQHAIFAYFIPPLSLFALLGGIMWINRDNNKSE